MLDRRCGSAQTAVEMAAALVASGTHDIVIAGGVEHMGHVPIDSPGKISELYGDPWPAGTARAVQLRAPRRERRADRRPLGASAARRWTNSPRAHTEWPPSAIAEGRFVAEMVPMTLDGQLRTSDQCVRPEHHGGDTGRAQAGLPQGGRADHRRVVLADLRRRRRGAAVLRPRPPSGTACDRVPASSTRPRSASTRSSC